MEEEFKKTGPRDVFMHLLTIITLYVSVITFGILIFNYIDIYFPDVLEYFYQSAASSLRWPISILVVVFPLYVILSYYLQKDLLRNPEKRELKIRKWLLYFTLFISTIVIVGDFVTVIFWFLSGGLTLPFLLKITAVFIIAASVFLYYGWNLKKEIPPSHHPKMKFFVKTTVILGGLAIIFGFYTVGSPQSERLRRFDERRVNDLQNIQSQIIYYWRVKEKLPEFLNDLKNDINGFVLPVDPQINEMYKYEQINGLSFRLCADFQTSSQNYQNNGTRAEMIPAPTKPYGIQENWAHQEGFVCFERTIDPDFFPPLRNQ
ncbi:MAG: DUF5671 domain-containing protein [Patescibacteria group bacterium]